MYDIAIIGAGVSGTLIARELAKYKLNICIIEKHADVCLETSKANSALVHAGFDAKHGTSKAKFNILGNKIMEKVCEELDVPYVQNGALVLGFGEEDHKTLKKIYENGLKNGVEKLSIINQAELQKLEPNVSKEATYALRAETAGIICPFKLTYRAAQCAVENGVDLKVSHEVINITKENDFFTIKTKNGEFESKYIINAAGVFADEIAKLCGDDTFTIAPRKGEYLLYDKKLGNTVRHTIYQTPTKLGKGVVVSPTVDENLLVGPSAIDGLNKEDDDTGAAALESVLADAKRIVPCVTSRDVITSFAGVRAVSSTDDFIIGFSEKVDGLLNVAGIQSPGLSSAPAIAVYVAELFAEKEKNLAIKENYNPRVEKRVQVLHLTPDELQKMVAKNPSYGKIICRCETVSKAEIIDSIQSAAGATTIDGVKRRTRAGTGRCQGGFCMPRILEIISRVKGIPFTEVTKKGDGSYILSTEKMPKIISDKNRV